jgi:hypothetical protein
VLPAIRENYHIVVKCVGACTFDIQAKTVEDKRASYNLSNQVHLSSSKITLFEYTHSQSTSPLLSFSLQGLSNNCFAEMFVSRSELPTRDNSL